MAIRETSNVADLVASFQQEAAHARRVWINWLGVGGGGGIIALLSFAANLPDPDYALRLLAPAIAAFIFAIAMAALALISQAEEHSSAASYYAEEHNGNERTTVAKAMPQVIASPQALSKKVAVAREMQMDRANEHHQAAETEWKRRTFWKWLRRVLIFSSASAFVIGASYPLGLVWAGTRLVPSMTVPQVQIQREEQGRDTDNQQPYPQKQSSAVRPQIRPSAKVSRLISRDINSEKA